MAATGYAEEVAAKTPPRPLARARFMILSGLMRIALIQQVRRRHV
jgi:hypothetical protein